MALFISLKILRKKNDEKRVCRTARFAIFANETKLFRRYIYRVLFLIYFDQLRMNESVAFHEDCYFHKLRSLNW